jgi:hypothetical protein
MATLWLQDGKLVTDGSSQPILCDDCPCEPSAECDICSGDIPLQMSVTLSGILNYSGSPSNPNWCTTCTSLNNTYVLDYSECCTWVLELDEPICCDSSSGEAPCITRISMFVYLSALSYVDVVFYDADDNVQIRFSKYFGTEQIDCGFSSESIPLFNVLLVCDLSGVSCLVSAV